MGLFDKIKSAAQKITGGGAKVTLSVEATGIKQPVKVHVTAEVKDNPIEIQKVYLYVKSIERIDIPRNELPHHHHNQPQPMSGINITKDVFAQVEHTVAPAQVLEAGQTYNWTYEFTLPAEAVPSYNGRFAQHNWMFYAGMDAKGNDPDSGWVQFDIF